MSCRQMRKLIGSNTLPPPEGNSDEEFEPLYVKTSAAQSRYQGLILSSHSESEHESTDAVQMESNEAEVDTLKKKKKKKKKQRKGKELPKSSLTENFDMDDIDKSLMEVNALLGAPSPAPPPVEEIFVDPVKELFMVTIKHLNVNNELKRMFGPDPQEPKINKRGRQGNLLLYLKKAVIVPYTHADYTTFQKFGLSMSINRRENGCTYFTFDHSKEYQRIHRNFIQYAHPVTPSEFVIAERNMHVEAWLECVDDMFHLEEYRASKSSLERIIAYMQYVAHPSFKLINFDIRLEYKFMENRPFHIAVLKYLHLLTNSACHRTALELAKLLLILDPLDPLAVIFIIDTLALRAREYKWLIDAVNHWKTERHAGFLFNLKFSYAMAHFHVITEEKGDMKQADKLLQTAIMQFPSVFTKILECASVTRSSRIQSHPFFSFAAVKPTEELNELIFLYAKFTWSKWREPGVMEWLTRNVNELLDKYDADETQFKELTMKCSMVSMYQSLPPQIKRHLAIIKPMSLLLVDGAVPRVIQLRAYDPIPPRGIDRYGYTQRRVVAPASTLGGGGGNSFLSELFTSILPYNNPVLEAEIDNQLVEELLREDLLADFYEGDNMTDTERNSGEDGNTEDVYQRYMNVFETENQPDTQPDQDTQNERGNN